MDDASRHKLFSELLDQHGPAIRRLCGGYERNEAMRHELEQEVLLNLWCALPSFRGDASLRTWMYRVAHNTATRHVSRAVKARAEAPGSPELDRQASPGPSPDEQADQSHARNQLQGAIYALAPLDRQLILLYLEDVPQAEIAHITGSTVANVSTRIHRIKADLKARLSP